MTEEEYIVDRLEKQQKWHSEESKHCKILSQTLDIAVLILSSSIPVISIFDTLYSRLAIAVISAIVAVFVGIGKVKKYHENWIHYRNISEALKREKYYYITKSGFYKNIERDSLPLLVERVEQIICDENLCWSQINSISSYNYTNQ